MSKCKCGTVNSANARYCQGCGRKIKTRNTSIKGISIILLLAFILCFVIPAEYDMLMGQEDTTVDKSIPERYLSESEIIRQKYEEITFNMPYVEDDGPTKTPEETLSLNEGDCDDKAVLFADWLYNRGYKDIYIVFLYSSQSDIGHACLEFNGRLYDLTDSDIYNATEDEAMGLYSLYGWETYEKYQYPYNFVTY